MAIVWAQDWFAKNDWQVFPFQKESWNAVLKGQSGLVNAPTGSGKTYSLLIPAIDIIQRKGLKSGIIAIWITPIRALAQEIADSANAIIQELFPDIRVAIRTGDTSAAERSQQKKQQPHILITTPESLHLMLASSAQKDAFKHLQMIVVDEWHELVGSKRGVQVELALSRLKGIARENGRTLQVWGISATIGNMEEAMQVLHGIQPESEPRWIKADMVKQTEIVTIMPEELEKLPWAGHLGIHLLDKVLPIIHQSKSTLLFTNTRSQAEIWYQKLLEHAPDFAGMIAMHHGSLDKQVRQWVEDALHDGILKVVVCTSSLDLGVDFRPVDTVIQVGSPKGVARFLQRAGRSGHQPGAVSKIYFLPTHSLEVAEGAALREAMLQGETEHRLPYIRSFDVLAQYLVTLATGGGFYPEEILPEVLSTFSFSSMSMEEWGWILNFITEGGSSLEAYEEFRKVEAENGRLVVKDRRIALRHRLSIGTIVGDTAMKVQFVSGGFIGTLEEYFVTKLKPGDIFWFGGHALELVRIKDMTVQVKKSKKKTGIVASWMGGRMPLSSNLSALLRQQMQGMSVGHFHHPELMALQPLIALQQDRSLVPEEHEFLVEYFRSREGYHLLMYPYEGRLVHEGMAALLAYRISQIQPISFSIAMNDYGFELLSDQELPIHNLLQPGLFSTDQLQQDIMSSINAAEMARRKFRDIAHIAGLVFRGYPGRQKKDRHLQASAQLFFEVFNDYDPENLLLRQASEEVMTFQLEEDRLRKALNRIQQQSIRIVRPDKPTPFSFPIMVDRLNREKLSSETLEDRIKKMQVAFG